METLLTIERASRDIAAKKLSRLYKAKTIVWVVIFFITPLAETALALILLPELQNKTDTDTAIWCLVIYILFMLASLAALSLEEISSAFSPIPRLAFRCGLCWVRKGRYVDTESEERWDPEYMTTDVKHYRLFERDSGGTMRIRSGIGDRGHYLEKGREYYIIMFLGAIRACICKDDSHLSEEVLAKLNK